MPETLHDHPVIFFDGWCRLCSATVRFVLKADRKGLFRFAPLSGPLAKELLPEHDLAVNEPGTLYLLENGRLLARSDAVLGICRLLPVPWRWLYLFRFLPRGLRDGIYRLIARLRYRLFGRRKTCLAPTENLADRFL